MKRLVFYFPGYDKRPIRHTFPLFRTECQRFFKIRGVAGALGDPHDSQIPFDGTTAWEGHADWPEGHVETQFVQLNWQDLIQPDFERSWPRTVRDGIRSFALYARAGGYSAAWKSNWAHAVFCLYPAIGLLLYLIISFLPPLLLAFTLPSAIAGIHSISHAGLIFWGVFLGASLVWMISTYAFMQWLETNSYFRYLVNSWYFIERLARNEHHPMSERIEHYADLIVARSENATEEEVVLVSHSCGTFVAVYILAAVLRRKPDFASRKGGFAFVTLGPAFECIGGYGAQHGFGDAMATVARSGADWTDLYSPHDPICGGRTPPVARYAALTKADGKKPEPRRFSICIPDRMEPATFRHLRYRFFKLHFCYFFASVKPGLFDFYRLTLGPKPAVDQLKAWNDGRD
ncbi:ABC transporter ATP-binding protein [Roseibium denhamense]|uniref:Alpha/beta hydrolase n=1 Tax=Roseibium denhamense TaxID=76305 RepID=A0ABY1NGE7_9HYPH|nr:ABC transporter ATP-binding protein [Roseibium denhamense]MTI06371.1 ABC transporter ATP-binding protein [Roseibium denhamense]SMP08660.1 hypothetical protein SAMN06265374_1000 [Roseibium denhamense]